MTRAHRIESWIAALVALALVAGVPVPVWQRHRPISLQGAVLVEDSDPRKQLPIADVTVSADDLAAAQTTTDPSGLFVLKLHRLIRKGHPMVLHFRHPQYRPFDLTGIVSNHLYVVRLTPLSSSTAEGRPQTVANVRVRYTVKAMTELNVGSAVKTFEIQNRGNVPCKGQHPCSPDGKWKAALGKATLDAGSGNEFRDVRASCIAGPCPFTRIESSGFPPGAQTITLLARDWSDTATFLLEAEVFRPMISQMEHWSYPVVFGDGLTFTLPADAESVSIEADLDGQSIIFPLGPTLFLSWATCDAEVNPGKPRVYRCAPKPGYRFE